MHVEEEGLARPPVDPAPDAAKEHLRGQVHRPPSSRPLLIEMEGVEAARVAEVRRPEEVRDEGGRVIAPGAEEGGEGRDVGPDREPLAERAVMAGS